MPKHIGGWQSGSRMYHIRFMNKGGYDIVHLQFSAKNANALLQKYNKLFFVNRAFQLTDIRQVAVALVKIQAVAHHKLVRHAGAHIIRL